MKDKIIAKLKETVQNYKGLYQFLIDTESLSIPCTEWKRYRARVSDIENLESELSALEQEKGERPTDEEIQKRFPINKAMIEPINLPTRNYWIQQGIEWVLKESGVRQTIKEKNMKKLYLLTVVRNYSFYVIAADPKEAEDLLTSELNRADWYFSDDRIVKEIKVLAEEVHEFPTGRPSFGNKNGDLLIKN